MNIDSLREAAVNAGQLLWREAGQRADVARREVSRRAGLAGQPQPQGVNGPKLPLLLAEIAALAPRNPVVPRYVASSPQPILLLPGFGSHPKRMRPLLRALAAAGHSPHEWGMGFNFGPTPENFAFLMSRLEGLHRRYGEPVALIGWSLGGLFAREMAKAMPAGRVSRVITLGSPFSGDRRANNAWRAYQLVTGHPVDEPPLECNFAAKPPVPTIALWSPRDGVIAPRCAAGWPGERDRAIAVRCNHLTFSSDPGSIAVILQQLDAKF